MTMWTAAGTDPPRSAETVSIEPDEPAMDDLASSYGIIGGADGPTVIVSGTAITG